MGARTVGTVLGELGVRHTVRWTGAVKFPEPNLEPLGTSQMQDVSLAAPPGQALDGGEATTSALEE